MSDSDVVLRAYSVAARCIEAYDEFVRRFGEGCLKQFCVNRYALLKDFTREASFCRCNVDNYDDPKKLVRCANDILVYFGEQV